MLLTTFRVPALIIATAASKLVLSLPLDGVSAQSARPLVARANGSGDAGDVLHRRNSPQGNCDPLLCTIHVEASSICLTRADAVGFRIAGNDRVCHATSHWHWLAKWSSTRIQGQCMLPSTLEDPFCKILL